MVVAPVAPVSLASGVSDVVGRFMHAYYAGDMDTARRLWKTGSVRVQAPLMVWPEEELELDSVGVAQTQDSAVMSFGDRRMGHAKR
jgi:hypothetical protein